jgi:radical SAM superfamily enzyme
VKDRFNTDLIYDKMDTLYISKAKAGDYEKYIGYVQDPLARFNDYVSTLRIETDKELKHSFEPKYKDYMINNLKVLHDRLEKLRLIMQEKELLW